ncbi:CapA family protein [Haloplasma contractile]|uniref:Capsule biosynthesis protein capA n=1 Tax=Haloplasma contractile SSD-17B TaxID=1033810 RepID=U2EGY3_9MOLU|nr:CapA family protein [Haloplasma contractile]ERJ13861.1 Capsule biosynthesis protein capA [Haloplasma contractile SSD-17B]
MNVRRFYLIIGYIIVILFFTLKLNHLNDQVNTDEMMVGQNNERTVSLVAVGDNLIHNTIYNTAFKDDRYDFNPIYEDINPYVSSFDLAFINQETMIGGTELGLSSYPRFNSPVEVGEAVVNAGFNLISLANNHTLDGGEEAIKNALHFWDSQPIVYSGTKTQSATSSVKRFEKNGIKFAFVAYTYGTNGILHPDGKGELANVFSKTKARNDIEQISDEVDVIIVSMHWGNQYQSLPSNEQRNKAEFLSELGVDLIIGHHPHVIQPVEMIETDGHQTFVMYSLGNFLSDQRNDVNRVIGMAVSLEIKKQDRDDGTKTIQLVNIEARLMHHFKDKRRDTFRILFFDDLTNQILKNHNLYFEEKKELIKTFYSDIEVR